LELAEASEQMEQSHYVNRHIVALTDIELADFCGLTTAQHGARIRAKCLASHWLTTSDIPAGMDIDDQEVEDVDILERDMLDADHATKFPKPWLVQQSDGTIHSFDTEDAACDFQRSWRQRYGLNPMTGEPVGQ
jgi:hypothetical protein